MTRNVETALGLVRAAAGEGAGFIALPEYFAYYGDEERWAEAAAMTPGILEAFMSEARSLGVYILAGAALVPSGADGKFANTSALIGPRGEELARYRKRHLFNVSLDTGEFCESKWLVAGEETTVARLEGWILGLSICFDLRFADHFATLRRLGASMLAAPSAFSMETGSAHWMTLVRARAIETQCYMIAPALWGECGKGKRCFGSTAIIDPWGKVAAYMEQGEGFVTALLDPCLVEDVRRKIPMSRALPFSSPDPGASK